MVKTCSFLQLCRPFLGSPLDALSGACIQREAEKGAVGYNENMPENLPGYCLTGDTGARLKIVITGDGQRLRVTYVPDCPYRDGTINVTVRIEVLPEQAGSA